MSQRTVLNATHVAAGARMTDFGGWDMPLHYGSQLEEHAAVRTAAGLFDVSHMTVVDLDGPATADYLRTLLANDIGKLTEDGQALYTCMLNERGGVIDDLIVYRKGLERYRAVVNAATRHKDLDWMQQRAAGHDTRLNERPDLAMLAVQGPDARKIAAALLPDAAAALALKPFRCAAFGDWFVARTGYTGEDGWEIMLPQHEAVAFWSSLVEAGVRPAGLGARDSLRLEAGLNLYGQDMDETTGPYESNLGWTVALDDPERRFVGRDALEAAGKSRRRLTGLVLEDRGVLRAGQTVTTTAGAGITTSGGFSPTLKRSIALARVPTGAGDTATVDVRGKALPVRVVRPPFVRRGKSNIDEKRETS